MPRLFRTLLLLLPIIATPSYAAIITNGNYTHDDTTDIVVGDGLEWLQWDRTVGLSWNQADALRDTIEGGGWQIASNTQMASLFNNFSFGLTFDTSEDTNQFVSTPIELGVEVGTDITFISMFGDTFAAAGATFNFGEGGFSAASAIYGQDSDGDGYINTAVVFDDFAFQNGDPLRGIAQFTHDFIIEGRMQFFVWSRPPTP